MGEIFEVPITRNPENCDSDIKAVCESVKFQNNGDKPNLLRDCEIRTDEIILKYETTG